MTYVPRILVFDKKKRKWSMEARGFVLAIPDVSDLCEFLPNFRGCVANLSPKRYGRSFYPADANIDLPAQSCLEYLRSLRSLAQSKAARETPSGGIVAIESYHMLKPEDDKRIMLLAFDRVANRPSLIKRYDRARDTFLNPLFRAAIMRSLLRDEHWFAGMARLFEKWPWALFLEPDDSMKALPRFGGDARRQFRGIFQDTKDMKPDEMDGDQRLARIIHRLVNRYIEGRAESKADLKVKNFPKEVVDGKDRTIYPKKFREAQQRVCTDAFLSMRSRRDQDFVEFFAGSICSVPQAISRDDFLFLTRILLTRPDSNPVGPRILSGEDIKAIAMIAVSAHSFVTQPREEATGLND